MTDPLAYVLWHLLSVASEIDPETLYAFDSARAERVLRAAHMRRLPSGAWTHSERTALWYEQTWADLRRYEAWDEMVMVPIERLVVQ